MFARTQVTVLIALAGISLPAHPETLAAAKALEVEGLGAQQDAAEDGHLAIEVVGLRAAGAHRRGAFPTSRIDLLTPAVRVIRPARSSASRCSSTPWVDRRPTARAISR